MQLVGRSCEHCRTPIHFARDGAGCERCGLAVHTRCASAADGYRGRARVGGCPRCGHALHASYDAAAPDAPAPPAPFTIWQPISTGMLAGVVLGVLVPWATWETGGRGLGPALLVAEGFAVAIATVVASALVAATR